MHFIHNYLNKYYTDINWYKIIYFTNNIHKEKQTNKQINNMLYSYLKNI